MFSPSIRRVADRLMLAIVMICLAFSVVFSTSCAAKKMRRFGATCGQNAECEGGVCYHGHCTASCTSDAQCGPGSVCIVADKVCESADGDADGDGLSNSYEIKHQLDPANPDSDHDGIPDGVEIGADQGNPVDSNHNGIPDALESNTEDADKDCIVDAWDVKPGSADPLPAPALICDFGVCQGQLSAVQTVCPAAVHSDVLGPDGCLGCACSAPGLKDWQALETWCDHLDNDCDGATDAGLGLEVTGTSGLTVTLPVGATCTASFGICASNGVSGVVQCGAARQAICSTDAGGSATLAKAEVCNGLDDNCDGKTDEPFTYLGGTIGKLCPSCDGQTQLCADGTTPVNPSVVTCSADGQSAVCSGQPFAPGFQENSSGLPAGRAVWSAAYVADWHSLTLFGGQLPTADGSATTADVWQLPTADLSVASTNPQTWKRIRHPGLPGRRGDALVFDGTYNRLLALGGVQGGTTAAHVLAISVAGDVTDVSAVEPLDPAFVPELPLASPFAAGQRAFAAMAKVQGKEAIIVWQPGAPPRWNVPSSGNVGWQVLPGMVSGDAVSCLTTDSTGIFVLSAQGDLYGLAPDGTTLGAVLLPPQGNAPQFSGIAQCASHGSGALEFFGLDATGSLAHVAATAVAVPLSLGSVVWSPSGPETTPESILARRGGIAAVDPSSGTMLIAGGYAWQDGNPHALVDVQARAKASPTVGRIDAEQPVGRIGEAYAWAEKLGKFCIGGGLQYDLPAGLSGPARAVPVTDVWCRSADGPWQKVTDAGPAFAFGVSGVDAVAGRLVLAGGLALTKTTAVGDISRLWTGGLLDGTHQIDPAWTPTSTVYAVDLTSGQVQVSSSADAPALAASGFVQDAKNNRVILQGGFDNLRETVAFYSLDLATLQWTNLGQLLPGADTGNSQHPSARMGALMIYDPWRDVLAVAGGSLRYMSGDPSAQNNYTAGLDSVEPGPGQDACNDLMINHCYGPKETLLWLARTQPSPVFSPTAVPAYADETSLPPQTPLLRRMLWGPAFLPVLYDAVGGRAWAAVQVAPAEPDMCQDGAACGTDVVAMDWTHVTVQLHWEISHCGDAKHPFVVTHGALSPIPSALLLAASGFSSQQRVGTIWGGIDQDGSLSGAFSVLLEGCPP